jgi:acetoacetyl-CoA synthetase
LEERVLWTPSRETAQSANITRYTRWLEEREGKSYPDYASLWRWSTENIREFWGSIWEYFGVWSSTQYGSVLAGEGMAGSRWFEGARLNYAEHVFRNKYDDDVAIVAAAEGEKDSSITWGELKAETAGLAAFLREEGVRKGDRVAGYLPNCPEAIVGLLATASLGAIWSCCSPELGPPSVIDRFTQISPKAFIGVEGYRYGGRWLDKKGVIEEVRGSIPSIETTIVTDMREGKGVAGAEDWVELGERTEPLDFVEVPFGHPLWILYTSGTTGLPKPIVHGHGGMLLEQLKALSLHNDLRQGDRMFWYTSTGWMMWNYLVGALILGSTVMLYDGDPLHPDPRTLWDYAERTKMTFLGAGASYFDALAKSGFSAEGYDLRRLRGVGSTGSRLSPSGFEWIYANVKDDLWVASISGGTDLCTAFVGGNPTLPVVSGRMQCRYLGASVEAFDESGNPMTGRVGELVITEPMPSMPLYLWGDLDGSRYKESYLSRYPGIWRHGDWVAIGEDGTCVIYGRSDATLKRHGVRAGTSEIYGLVESTPEVLDSLVVDVEVHGESSMILFIVLKEGKTLDASLRETLRKSVREGLSPRLVPDEVVQIDEVPRTVNGKKVEVPVKRILMGTSLEEAVSRGALKNPRSLDFFVDYRKRMVGPG